MFDTTTTAEQKPIAGQDSLSVALQARFEAAAATRKPQEEKFLMCYSDAMRIPREESTKETGMSEAQKSKLFIGSTRGKIRSARAKIKDSLFGSGKMPFDTTPSNEKLKKYADTVERILAFQFKDMGFKSVVGGGVDILCTYGTGVMFGPFVKEKTHTSADVIDGRLAEQKFPYPCPYFEVAPTMDVYPEGESHDTQQGMGVFWSSWKQSHEVQALKKLDGYNAGAIDYACKQLSTNSSSEGSDRTTDQRANLYRFSRDGRVRLVRLFGLVGAADLAAWEGARGTPDAEVDDEEMVEVIIIMAGGVVIKADRSPYKEGRRPAHRCVYEEVTHEFWGVGIAENNEPHQKVVNASFRLYIEGKAFALLKTCSVDRSAFEASENFEMFPGKRYQMRPGLTPEQRKTALLWHDVADVTQGWENVIDLSERFSDDDTGITKYSQGTDSNSLNKTATGVSLIMGASSLPMKEVIQNIDEMWIEKAVESLVDWDFENLTPEAVATLLGPEDAALWAEIQQFGKASFMSWKATGSSTFMVKEVLMQKLQGFLQLIISTPSLEQLVDVRELLEQVWDSGEIGKESPIYSDEDLKMKQGAGKLPPEIENALQQQEELIKKLEADAASKQGEQQIKLAEIASRERLEMQRLMISDRDSHVKAEQGLAQVDLTEAQIDKTEAETVGLIIAAGLAPEQHQIDVALAEHQTTEQPDEGGRDGDQA